MIFFCRTIFFSAASLLNLCSCSTLISFAIWFWPEREHIQYYSYGRLRWGTDLLIHWVIEPVMIGFNFLVMSGIFWTVWKVQDKPDDFMTNSQPKAIIHTQDGGAYRFIHSLLFFVRITCFYAYVPKICFVRWSFFKRGEMCAPFPSLSKFLVLYCTCSYIFVGKAKLIRR